MDDLKLISDTVSTPCFIYCFDTLSKSVRDLQALLAELYPKTSIYYSVKTNYLSALLRDMAKLGVKPEVIAGYELDLIDRLGLFSNEVIVNGPLKLPPEIERSIRRGALINIDNFDEIHRIRDVAQSIKMTARVGIRINAKIGALPWNRFGFSFESGDGFKAAQLIASFNCMSLQAVHIHIGTNVLEPESYRTAAKVACQFVSELETQLGVFIPNLDFGGGFPTDIAPMQHGETPWEPAPMRDFMHAICSTVKEQLGDGRHIIIEPGRLLVDRAFSLLTSVQCIRGEDRREVVIDAGINMLPSTRYRNHRIQVVSENRQSCSPVNNYRLVGPTCMGHDILFEKASLPQLHQGDLLQISHAGAYSLSMAFPFIRVSPPVVRRSKGDVHLVKRRETIEDIMCRDIDQTVNLRVSAAQLSLINV